MLKYMRRKIVTDLMLKDKNLAKKILITTSKIKITEEKGSEQDGK